LEQSPSREVNSDSSSQEIPRLLWDRKIFSRLILQYRSTIYY